MHPTKMPTFQLSTQVWQKGRKWWNSILKFFCVKWATDPLKFFVYTQESDSGHHFKMIVVLRMKYAKKGTVQGVSV